MKESNVLMKPMEPVQTRSDSRTKTRTQSTPSRKRSFRSPSPDSVHPWTKQSQSNPLANKKPQEQEPKIQSQISPWDEKNAQSMSLEHKVSGTKSPSLLTSKTQNTIIVLQTS